MGGEHRHGHRCPTHRRRSSAADLTRSRAELGLCRADRVVRAGAAHRFGLWAAPWPTSSTVARSCWVTTSGLIATAGLFFLQRPPPGGTTCGCCWRCFPCGRRFRGEPADPQCGAAASSRGPAAGRELVEHDGDAGRRDRPDRCSGGVLVTVVGFSVISTRQSVAADDAVGGGGSGAAARDSDGPRPGGRVALDPRRVQLPAPGTRCC